MLLTTLAFLFIAFFRMTIPSIRKKKSCQKFKMSFCDSRDLEKIASVPIRDQSVALRVRLL